MDRPLLKSTVIFRQNQLIFANNQSLAAIFIVNNQINNNFVIFGFKRFIHVIILSSYAIYIYVHRECFVLLYYIFFFEIAFIPNRKIASKYRHVTCDFFRAFRLAVLHLKKNWSVEWTKHTIGLRHILFSFSTFHYITLRDRYLQHQAKPIWFVCVFFFLGSLLEFPTS